MPSKAEFCSLLANAYEHLYDLVHLRTHPLAKMLVSDAALDRDETAWHLHHTLLDAIDKLSPCPEAPAFSREWRRHRLLALHYVDGLSYAAVADQLAISQRSFYRERDAAIEAIADLLMESLQAPDQAPQPAQEPAAERLELLRLEAERLAQADQRAKVSDVLAGVLELLRENLEQHQIHVELALPPSLPEVSVDGSLLRQVLLGTVGHLVVHAEQAKLRLAAEVDEGVVWLSLAAVPPEAVSSTRQAQIRKRLATLEEMAALCKVQIETRHTGEAIVGFRVGLPTERERTILVIDDNEDVIELIRRFLHRHQYHVVGAQAAQEALALARQLQPHAITLDLMMPGQDGWDVLQTLLNQPETCHIPIIVCSVLREEELALSLGSTAFLEKPVTEQALLSVLQRLDQPTQPEM